VSGWPRHLMLVSGELCSDPLGTLQKVFPSCTDNEAHGAFAGEVFLVFSSKNESKHKLVSIQLEKDPLTTSMMIRDGIRRDNRDQLGEMTVALCYAAAEQAAAEQDPTKMQIDDIIMIVSTNTLHAACIKLLRRPSMLELPTPDRRRQSLHCFIFFCRCSCAQRAGQGAPATLC